MRRYAELVRGIAEREVAGWPAGAAVAARPRMQAITLEVIMRAIFGVEDPARLARLRAALERMLDWTTDPRRLFLVAGIGPRRLERVSAFRAAMDPVHALLEEEIARGRSDPRLEGREDILALLLQAHPARRTRARPMHADREEIRDELITLLVAGHETTATALAWALERLARHPAAWARLREEVAAGEEDYLDAVVKETLRLRPVLPIVLRHLKAPLRIGGWDLPAGVSVVPCIYLVHRDPAVYPDPLAFRPERFLESPAGTYTWIPFGGGDAALPRRELRAVRDEDRAARDRRPRAAARRRPGARALDPPGDHARARRRGARRGRLTGFEPHAHVRSTARRAAGTLRLRMRLAQR